MSKLTPGQGETVIRRRGTKSEKTGTKQRIDSLEVHHKNRNPDDNRPENLRVLTKKEHDDLHSKYD